jgi:RNA-binding protein 5/10
LEVFSKFAQVKDIRMIKDRMTYEKRDFAFVEYFTLEDATKVVELSKKSVIQLKGHSLFVTFSRIKRNEAVGGNNGEVTLVL